MRRPSAAELRDGPYMGIRGRAINFLNPDPSDFQPEEIARSLALENRYAGSYGPYSVAQHACLVAGVVAALDGDARQQLGALHHDDTEAVTGDLPRPVKSFCSDFREIERRLSRAVDLRFMVDTSDPLIKQADQQVFRCEVERLVPAQDRWIYEPYLAEIKGTRVELAYELLIPWGEMKSFARYMDMHTRLDAAADRYLINGAVASDPEMRS